MEKTKGEQLQEELMMKMVNGTTRLSDEEIDKAYDYAEGYKKYMDAAKIEMEAVREAIRQLKENGYEEFVPGKKYQPGERFYYNNRGKAILAATNSGRTARMICRFRPACPVAALTMHEKVRRQLAICWGVIPFLTGEVTSTDRIFSLSAEVALKERLVQNGDTVVITAGVPLGKSGSTNLIKAAIVNEELM